MTDFLLLELIDAKNEIENSFQNLNNLKDKVEKLEKKLNKADTRNDDQNSSNDDPNNSQSETQSELNNLKAKIGNLETRIQALEQDNLPQQPTAQIKPVTPLPVLSMPIEYLGFKLDPNDTADNRDKSGGVSGDKIPRSQKKYKKLSIFNSDSE